MKRILLAAMASIALLISSCGKSDDSSGDITGIWQKESETVDGQSQTIDDCEKKSAVVFTQNQMTTHDFIENAGACRYSKHVDAYKIEGNAIKSDEDSSISFPFSVSGNTLTIEFVENAKKFVFKYKKITQAELDAILATANNNNGGGNKNAQNLEGIWQKESETVDGQSQTINECGKPIVIFNQNQATTHSFSKNTGVCKYHKNIDTYQIIGNTIKGLGGDDESFTFSLSGNTLTFEIIRNGEKGIHKFKKITQAELDAFLATVNNNNGGGNKNAQNLEGIWQIESETVDGQSQTINDCEKKSAVAITQNQITSHNFSEVPGFCRYNKHVVHAYKIEGNAIKSNEDPSISFPFSVSGNTLTIESVKNGKKTILKYRKITQAELDAILATVNNGGN